MGKKLNTKIVIFLILFFSGISIGIVGMFMPPTGIIHPSVLIFVAQIFVLAAGIYGFEIKVDLQNGKISTSKKDEEDEVNNNE